MKAAVPNRVAIRGVNWLGDAVMALPALERLREHWPSAHIALATASKLADLFTTHPAINEVIAFEKKDGVLSLSKRLRSGSFDLALILPNSFRSALEAWLARIPARVGYGGSGRGPLLTRAVSRRSSEVRMHKRSDGEVRTLISRDPNRPRDTFPPAAHHLHQYLHLVAALGARSDPHPPRIPIDETERAGFRAKFNVPGSRRILGLNPGAEYGPAKRWPIERFIETASAIEATWLIFGGVADSQAAATIQSALGSRAINVAGRTTLRDLCVGLSLCEFVLTNDTGPMHLAAATGARVIVPFGSTSPELTGPGMPGDNRHHFILGHAPCAPCFRRTCPVDFRCMLSIRPEEVISLLKNA